MTNSIVWYWKEIQQKQVHALEMLSAIWHLKKCLLEKSQLNILWTHLVFDVPPIDQWVQRFVVWSASCCLSAGQFHSTVQSHLASVEVQGLCCWQSICSESGFDWQLKQPVFDRWWLGGELLVNTVIHCATCCPFVQFDKGLDERKRKCPFLAACTGLYRAFFDVY